MLQQISQNIRIKCTTSFKRIYAMFILRMNFKYNIKIRATLLQKFRGFISTNIKIKNRIIANIYTIFKVSSEINIHLQLSNAIHALLNIANNNNPFKINISMIWNQNPTVGFFRKLFNMGYTTEQQEEYYDIPLWAIDDYTLFYLDVQDDYWVYWGCNPYNYQALYSLQGFGSDNVQKQGSTWRVNRNTQIYLAQNDNQPNYNYIQQSNVNFVSQIDQLYKIQLSIQGINTSQHSVLCNILSTLNSEPSGQTEGIYLSSGMLYLYVLQQRFTQQPQQSDIYNWMVQNGFKVLIPLQQTQTTTVQNPDTIASLNKGQLTNIQGKIAYTNSVENQTPDNPLIFFGYGELQFIVTE